MVRGVRLQRSVVLGLALTMMLAGCATGTTAADDGGAIGAHAGAATGDDASPTPTTVPAVDAEAEATAQSWLDGAVLPPGAVSSEKKPTNFLSYYAWPCQPMVERTAYWTIEGGTVAETANWLAQNPTGGLMVTTPVHIPEDTDYDEATVGNAPAYDSLEGIAYTITRMPDGVAVRAEIGAMPAGAECPEGNWGGPGQG